MAFVPFPSVSQVNMRFLFNGQHCENVYHVRTFGDLTAEDMEPIAAAFKNWWIASIKNRQTGDLALTSILVTGLATPTSPGIEYVTGLPMNGGNAGAGLPNNVALAIKWITALRGRSFRGRTYHMGITEGQVVGNTVDVTELGLLQTGYNALIPALDAVSASLVVASRVTGGAERATGLDTLITNAVVDSTVDSQRRRLPGRGQ